jgi:predicted acetyltransferase
MDDSTQRAGTVMLEEVGAAAVPLLRRLMQLYLYDLGTLDGWRISEEGLFGDEASIERFWSEPGRRSFLIRLDGELAGFALIRDQATYAGAGTHEVSEFFVLRKFRRRGVGERAAVGLFDKAPGPWELTQLASNLPAQEFWRRVIGRYTGGDFADFEHAHTDWGWPWQGRVMRFTTPATRSHP